MHEWIKAINGMFVRLGIAKMEKLHRQQVLPECKLKSSLSSND